MTCSILIALADGFEEIEAVTPIDVLRRAGFDVLTVGLAASTVTGSHGVVFGVDRVWGDLAGATPDVLVLPGGLPGSKHLGEHRGLEAMARRVFAKNSSLLGAICAAPAFTLGAWGLLSGRRATCYPGCETRFPADVSYQDAPVVIDGNIVTARGPGVALDFALALVEQLSGAQAADNLKKQMQCA